MRRPLYAPRQPSPTTVAPPNTHAVTFTHKTRVCTYPPLAQSPELTNACGRSIDSSLYILPTTGSSTFNWFNLVKRFQGNRLQTSHILLQTSSIMSSSGHDSAAFLSTQIIFAGVRWWKHRNNGVAGLVNVLTSILCVCGCDDLVGTCHVTTSSLYCLLLQIIIQPWGKLSGTN